MQTPLGGRSLVERLLGGAILLLIAALALRWAVEVVLSIIWLLVGVAAVALLLLAAWRLWRADRGNW